MPADLSFQWLPIHGPPAQALRLTRLVLHWALQAVSAQADALLARADDDSQSNLGYAADGTALVTRALPGNWKAGLDLTQAAWILLGPDGKEAARQPITGLTLAAGLAWFQQELTGRGVAFSRAPTRREYDLPDAPYATAAFPALSSTACAGVHDWFLNGDQALRAVAATDPNAGAVRCWPHHFDIGTLITLDPGVDAEKARSIGVGLSPGDGGYDEPYFYVNLFPGSDKHTRPELPAGTWHTEGWFGGVLTGTEIQAADDQSAAVHGFLTTAIAANRAALA